MKEKMDMLIAIYVAFSEGNMDKASFAAQFKELSGSLNDGLRGKDVRQVFEGPGNDYHNGVVLGLIMKSLFDQCKS